MDKAQIEPLLDKQIAELTVSEAILLAILLDEATDEELAELGLPKT